MKNYEVIGTLSMIVVLVGMVIYMIAETYLKSQDVVGGAIYEFALICDVLLSRPLVIIGVIGIAASIVCLIVEVFILSDD